MPQRTTGRPSCRLNNMEYKISTGSPGLRPIHGRKATVRGGWIILGAVLFLGGCDGSDSSPASTYEITVYYTAVETFHGGAAMAVYGRLSPADESGDALLGTYPAGFVEAVQSEGTGRITSGTYAGRYLNWSYDVGFWLDAVPANAYGDALAPFQTAAADPDVLARGARFQLLAPLVQDDGTPLDSASAARFLAAAWNVQDQFTPGSGGAHHLDLYIGEEDRPDFTGTSPLYTTLVDVKIEFR